MEVSSARESDNIGSSFRRRMRTNRVARAGRFLQEVYDGVVNLQQLSGIF